MPNIVDRSVPKILKVTAKGDRSRLFPNPVHQTGRADLRYPACGLISQQAHGNSLTLPFTCHSGYRLKGTGA